MDAVFKALADPTRRELLDRLNARNGQTLNELCAGMGMARQSVTKHLAVLEAAGLVTTARRGRERLHYLDVAPINDIADRWIGRYNRARVQAIADLKQALEEHTMSDTEFVYTTYIRTTPEKLWEALTSPAFQVRYWGDAQHSDWKAGSPVLWQSGPTGEPKDWDQDVLEAVPNQRLSYTWHNYQPDHAAMFGWTAERLAELQKEKRSQVAFEIEPAGEVVKLTVRHTNFEPNSEMLRGVSQGWPAIIANLKTLLESGEPLPFA